MAAGQVDQPAARALVSGDAIYHAGCAGCHGAGGEGAPETTIGFDKPETFPDFTRCDQTTPELDVDWKATIRDGGHGRGFSPIMPSFRDELTSAQIDAVIKYLRGFCRDTAYPRGELNLPRPLRTEKAFPEDETVLTTSVTARHQPDTENELVYERRFGARTQIEIAAPFSSVHDETGTVARGVGDLVFGLKRVMLAGRNSIVSVQGEVALPTGNEAKSLGAGVTTFGLFATYGQILPAASFLQAQVGTDQPTSTEIAPRTVFGRIAIGKSFRQDGGVGRLWSPMAELVADRDFATGARTTVDLLPEFQVTLNRRQHIRVNAGLQIPVSNTAGRSKQFVFYLLWDWFDGGFLDGWR